LVIFNSLFYTSYLTKNTDAVDVSLRFDNHSNSIRKNTGLGTNNLINKNFN